MDNGVVCCRSSRVGLSLEPVRLPYKRLARERYLVDPVACLHLPNKPGSIISTSQLDVTTERVFSRSYSTTTNLGTEPSATSKVLNLEVR